MLFPSSLSDNECRSKGWKIEPQCGDIPPISSGSTLLSSKTDLYLILGFNECFNVSLCDNLFYPYDTIYKYNIKLNEWRSISVNNNPNNIPPGRAFAGIDITEDDGDIIVYGGANYDNFFNVPPSTFYSDFWKYSIDDNQWTEIIPSNPVNDPNVPGQWSLVGLVANTNFVYTFGGFSFTDPQFTGENDLYRYEFATNLWTKLNTNNPPPGRGTHTISMFMYPHKQRFVF